MRKVIHENLNVIFGCQLVKGKAVRISNTATIAEFDVVHEVHTTRFELKLNIVKPDSDQADNLSLLWQSIQLLVTKLTEIDKSVKILYWNNASGDLPLNIESPLPDLVELHLYIPRITPVDEGNTWGDIRIQHSST